MRIFDCVYPGRISRFSVGIIILVLVPVVLRAQEKDPRFLSYVTTASGLDFYWKDGNGQTFRTIQNVKSFVEKEGKELKFAMNGGMYREDNVPQGLFIQNKVRLTKLDTSSGPGNFYLKPNGVFYVTDDDKAVVCQTSEFVHTDNVKLATNLGQC